MSAMISNSNTSNQFPRWNNQSVIRFLKDNLEDEEEIKAKALASKRMPKPKPTRKHHGKRVTPLHHAEIEQRVERTKTPDHPQTDTRQVQVKPWSSASDILDPSQAQRSAPKEEGESSSSSPHQAYNILRTLPGYTIGEPLRKQDKVLCYCKIATSYAMSKLQPGDCAFIWRSDGSFTYAIYEGFWKGDSSQMSFQVDDKKHYKKIPIETFVDLVKVPVLLGRGGAKEVVDDTANKDQQRRRGSRRSSLPGNMMAPSNIIRSSVVVSRRSSLNVENMLTSRPSLPSLLMDEYEGEEISVTSSTRCCAPTFRKSYCSK